MFNESLAGRFDRLASRIHGIKGHTVHPQVSPEIQHVIVLESDRLEFDYLQGGSIEGWGGSLIAVAAKFAGVQLWNPPSSGALVVVEMVVCTTTNWIMRMLHSGRVAGGSGGTGSLRDSRIAGAVSATPSSTVTVDVLSLASITGETIGQFPALAVIAPPRGIAVLGENSSLSIAADTLNTAINIGVFWRVRKIEEHEK